MGFIELEKITKEYFMGDQKILAVNQASFSIEKGEMVVILGPSGAGKSTILNLLGGMDTATSGHLFVDGQDLSLIHIQMCIRDRREQFGKPLYKNQYLAFKMVELECQIEQARLMLYKAALDKSEGRPYTLSAAKAKLLCTDAAMHVTTEAVQTVSYTHLDVYKRQL